jgi:hypothetical protein
MSDINLNDDLLDEGLRAVMGPDRCQTSMDWQPKAKKAPEKKPTEPRILDKALDAQYEPARPEPNWLDKLKTAVKGSLLTSALCLLIWYWQQTGLMDPVAALPSMLVCMLMTGVSIGKVATK